MGWSSDDRDIAVVWAEEQKQKCPQCGTSSWEWEEWVEPWHADHFTCHGCAALERHRRNLEGSPGSKDGVKLALYRTARGV